jgi:peptidoglycan/xylan/chitin deacetylase (PgdA/CDA1 family)
MPNAMNEITVVMYHYIRDLSRTRYPGIKGLEVKDFIEQVDFLADKYNFVRMEDCLMAIRGEGFVLPENALLLTFDDGYLEHYTNVFPILDRKGVQGSFFPTVLSTTEDVVLDVNKIHLILSVSGNHEYLLDLLRKEINSIKNEFKLDNPEDYFSKIEPDEHPYDSMETIIFKRVLQRELPLDARQFIIDKLFESLVGVPDKVVSNELYMNEEQLKHMIRKGMFVGGHGYSHKWLNSLDYHEKRSECELTMSFLTSLGMHKNQLTMCYPYGGYDNEIIEILETCDYSAGFTTVPEVTELSLNHRFEIGRIDTNEIRKSVS